jgi:hypothetical protein
MVDEGLRSRSYRRGVPSGASSLPLCPQVWTTRVCLQAGPTRPIAMQSILALLLAWMSQGSGNPYWVAPTRMGSVELRTKPVNRVIAVPTMIEVISSLEVDFLKDPVNFHLVAEAGLGWSYPHRQTKKFRMVEHRDIIDLAERLLD